MPPDRLRLAWFAAPAAALHAGALLLVALLRSPDDAPSSAAAARAAARAIPVSFARRKPPAGRAETGTDSTVLAPPPSGTAARRGSQPGALAGGAYRHWQALAAAEWNDPAGSQVASAAAPDANRGSPGDAAPRAGVQAREGAAASSQAGRVPDRGQETAEPGSRIGKGGAPAFPAAGARDARPEIRLPHAEPGPLRGASHASVSSHEVPRSAPEFGPRPGRGERRDPGNPSGSSGVTFRGKGLGVAGAGPDDGQSSIFARYLDRVRRLVQRQMRLDRARAIAGDMGWVIVRYVIERDGTLGDVRILRSSGIAEFDRDALAAVRRAAPFAPIPEALGIPRLVVQGTLKYNNPVVP